MAEDNSYRSPVAPILAAGHAVLSLLLMLAAIATSSAQPPESPIAAMRRAESVMTALIEQSEPSIVAISRAPAARVNQSQRQRLLQAQGNRFAQLRSLQGNFPPTATGAGIVIDPAGLILTQYLAITPGDQHQITTIEGKTFPATIKGADPRSGLAVLHAPDAQLQALPIGRAERLKKGSFVLALGNPFAIVTDGQPSASIGAVTNLGRKAPEGANLNNTPLGAPELQSYRTTLHHFGTLIQTDARLGWSAPGGALVDLDGELVGITTTASTTAGHEQPAGYAIPLNETFRRVVRLLKQGREVEYGMLGISFEQGRPGAPAGVPIGTALSGSPASRAGLRAGDRITRIAEQPILGPDDLQLAVGSLPPDTAVPVEFQRGGQEQSTSLRLAKYYVLGKKIITDKPPSWRGIQVDYATAIPPLEFRESSRLGQIDPEGCVVVAEVEPNSISWRSGVRPGMFISHVGDQRVTTPGEFRTAVGEADNSVNLRFTKGAPPANKAAKNPPLRPQPANRAP